MIERLGDGRYVVGEWATGTRVIGGEPLNPRDCWAAILRFNELLKPEESPPSPFVDWTEGDLDAVFAFCEADAEYPRHIIRCAREWIAAGANAQ